MQTNLIKFNTYKLENGGLLVDMYDQFNARVGDQGTPLVIQWTQGTTDTPVDLQKNQLHFYATGQVGKYLEKLDDGTGYKMSADASGVEYEDKDSAGTQANGITVAKLPKQFFPQEGIFYGYFGLKDASGNAYTSINVWFRVLGGVPIMGAAIPYFSTRFDELMETCQGRIEDALAQLRQEYQAEVKKNEDMSDETRAALSKLADAVGAIQAQIDAGNVVTLIQHNADIKRTSEMIENKLAQMSMIPETFVNADAIKEAYPNGKAGIMVAVDTGHKWIYANGQWNDCGVYQSAGIDEATEEKIYAKNSDNLVANSDFNGFDLWQISEKTDYEIQDDDATNNSHVLMFSGKSDGAYISSKEVPVGNHKTVSWGLLVRGEGISTANVVSVSLEFKDTDHNKISGSVIQLDESYNDGKYHTIKQESIDVPTNTVTIDLTIFQAGPSRIYLKRPQINFGRYLFPYSLGDEKNMYAQSYTSSATNLLVNADFVNQRLAFWNINGDSAYGFDTAHTIDQSNILYLPGNAFKTVTLVSDKVNVGLHDIISYGLLIRGENINASNTVSMGVTFYDTNNSLISSSFLQLDESYNSDQLKKLKMENIKVPGNTTTVELSVSQSGASQLWIARPQLNFGGTLYPYSLVDNEIYKKLYISSPDNILLNSEFINKNLIFWNVGGEPLPSYDFETDNSFNNSNILHFVGNQNAASYIASDSIAIGAHTSLSAAVLIRGKNINSTDHIASFSLEFHDANGAKLVSPAVQLNEDYNDDNFHLVKIEGAVIPEGAVTADISFFQTSGSELWIVRPQMNFGPTLIPYSLDSLSPTDKPASSTFNSNMPRFFIQCDDVIGDKKVNAGFSFDDADRSMSGYMQISIQGASSRQYPKKNYKIKLFADSKMTAELKIKPKPSWTADSSFNLKANWIDATQARNLVNAKVFANATASTPFENEEVQQHLASTQNLGQMEGFPVIVYLNGRYHGLYTFNIKKNATVFGMDSSNPEHEAITIEDNSVQAKLRDKAATVDMLHFATVVHDNPSDELKQNFTAFLNFLNTASDEDFKNQIGNYIDVKSAINVYLYQALAEMWDGSTKSYIFLTYNGGKYFYLVDYDLDSSWGLWWDGSKVATDAAFDFTHLDQASFLTQENNNLLFQRIYQNFKPEIKSQYQKLRQSVWSNVSIMKQFKEFINSIPEAAYNNDHKVWPNIPSREITSYSQIQNDIIRRGNQMDAWISHLA